MKSFALSIALTIAVCIVIAGALVATVPAIGGWRIALVNSLCIGILACVAIDGGRRALWRERPPPVAGMIALCLFGIAAAVWFGGHLASFLVGNPVDWLTGDGADIRQAALLATVAGTLVITSLVWVHQYTATLRLRTQLEQARADSAAKLADEARLRMLRAQLEPHMLFNTLATLRALIGVDPPLAQRMLDHLVSFLRTTLNASRQDRIPLHTEFELLHDYLELMAVRMGDRLTYRVHLAPELAEHPVPPLLLQPIVENAIRHGLEPQATGGHLDITARQHGDAIQIMVVDDGAGLPDALPDVDESPENTAGFGLDAVRARLRAAFGDNATLDMASPHAAPDRPGTRITLTLPGPPD